jgi:hypothetical protein
LSDFLATEIAFPVSFWAFCLAFFLRADDFLIFFLKASPLEDRRDRDLTIVFIVV